MEQVAGVLTTLNYYEVRHRVQQFESSHWLNHHGLFTS